MGLRALTAESNRLQALWLFSRGLQDRTRLIQAAPDATVTAYTTPDNAGGKHRAYQYPDRFVADPKHARILAKDGKKLGRISKSYCLRNKPHYPRLNTNFNSPHRATTTAQMPAPKAPHRDCTLASVRTSA